MDCDCVDKYHSPDTQPQTGISHSCRQSVHTSPNIGFDYIQNSCCCWNRSAVWNLFVKFGNEGDCSVGDFPGILVRIVKITSKTPEFHYLNHPTPLSVWYMSKNFDFFGHPVGWGTPFLSWNNCSITHILTIFPCLNWYLQWYSQCIIQLIVMCLQGSLFLYFPDKNNRFLPQQFFN